MATGAALLSDANEKPLLRKEGGAGTPKESAGLYEERRLKEGIVKRTARGRRKNGTIAAGLRAVALFEAAKGVVVIIAGLGLLALIHRDVQALAEDVVRHLHFNPAKRFPRIFLDAAAAATDARLWTMALTAIAYSVVRFVEAVGLWRQRVWAEWFGILSGSIYLPVELYELTVSIRAVKLVILAVNLFIVGWLSWVRWQARGRRK
jgi:uncharacterized membrane protein (DUF2068 family)